jgi:hypothetical protein
MFTCSRPAWTGPACAACRASWWRARSSARSASKRSWPGTPAGTLPAVQMTRSQRQLGVQRRDLPAQRVDRFVYLPTDAHGMRPRSTSRSPRGCGRPRPEGEKPPSRSVACDSRTARLRAHLGDKTLKVVARKRASPRGVRLAPEMRTRRSGPPNGLMCTVNPLAQGIEQRFPKPCAAGSNPAGGTTFPGQTHRPLRANRV